MITVQLFDLIHILAYLICGNPKRSYESKRGMSTDIYIAYIYCLFQLWSQVLCTGVNGDVYGQQFGFTIPMVKKTDGTRLGGRTTTAQTSHGLDLCMIPPYIYYIYFLWLMLLHSLQPWDIRVIAYSWYLRLVYGICIDVSWHLVIG